MTFLERILLVASVFVPQSAAAQGLELAWQRSIGAGYSGITVVGDVAVTMASSERRDRVLALSLTDGEILWSHDMGPTFAGIHGSEDGPSSTPLALGSKVVAAGPRGTVVCLDLASGRREWGVELVRRHGVRVPVYGFGASPIAIPGDRIYLPVSTRDGRAGLALELASGALAWTHRGDWTDYQRAVRIGDGLLHVDSNAVHRLTADGDLLWTFDHGVRRELGHPQPRLLGEDRLLLSSKRSCQMYRMVGDGLQLLWTSREIKDCYHPPVQIGDALYGLSGTFLVCIDAETGGRRWKSREPGARSLTLDQGELVLLSSSGAVVLVASDPDGYREIVRRPVADRGGYTAALGHAGRILMRNTEAIYCLSRSTTRGARTQAADMGLPGELQRLLSAGGDELDRWWRANPLPIYEAGRLHFFFRGEARDVALLGSPCPDQRVPIGMHPIAGTDLFHCSIPSPQDGLWQYAFLVDFERAIPDPRNRWQVPTLEAIGGNPGQTGYAPPDRESVVALPAWQRPGFWNQSVPDAAVERLEFRAQRVSGTRALQIYEPAGASGWILALGRGWFDAGRLPAAVAAAAESGLRNAVVVELPYDCGSRDRLDAGEYASLVVEEILPVLSERLGRAASIGLLAAADNAAAALLISTAHPGSPIDAIALMSPHCDPDDFRLLRGSPGPIPPVYLASSRWEPVIQDENIDYRRAAAELRRHLAEQGTPVRGGEFAQAPGWPAWSALLPRGLALLLAESR